jgi:hypothetical protein
MMCVTLTKLILLIFQIFVLGFLVFGDLVSLFGFFFYNYIYMYIFYLKYLNNSFEIVGFINCQKLSFVGLSILMKDFSLCRRNTH